MKQKIKWFSLWISLIIIIFFILQVFISEFTEFFILNDRANNGEFWRFLTSIFLHGGISHLVYNLFALIFFGLILESLIGSRRFLWVFFLSGIIANVIAIDFYEWSLGASGAIYGVIGALTIIRPLFVVFAFGIPMPLFLASALWITGDILRGAGAFGPTNIGTIAHLTGIVVGFIFGFMYRSKKTKEIGNNKAIISESSIKKWEDNFMKDV